MPELLLPVLVFTASALLAWPMGRYMAWALGPGGGGGLRSRFDAVLGRLLGPAATSVRTWRGYCLALLAFNAILFAVAFAILRLQHLLPLNPAGKEAMAADLAFNTAASFTSNTNLQHYSGEVALSYLSQLLAIGWLQFVSAATGIAALAALARGLAGSREV